MLKIPTVNSGAKSAKAKGQKGLKILSLVILEFGKRQLEKYDLHLKVSVPISIPTQSAI